MADNLTLDNELEEDEDRSHDENIKEKLGFILDIPLRLTVEFGRSVMSVNHVLQLAEGSVIDLNKAAGDPLDIMINDKLIARGEVVISENRLGIRIIDIVSQMERVEKLSG